MGLGWNDPEYEALDMDFSNRAKRMEEQIEVCRALWTGQHVTFEGRYHKISDAGVAPMPVQRPIPIWIGAFARPAIARAARIADGWQAMLPKPDAAAAETFTGFKAAVAEAGRSPEDVGIEASIFATGTDTQAWAEEANAWLAAGATQIMFRPQGSFSEILRATEGFAGVLADLRG